MTQRNFGLDNKKHSEQPDEIELFAWAPKRMTSGKIVWLTHYWYVRRYTNVEPKHKWIVENTYTQWEYFIKKLSDG